jgi:hypothetical protein
MLNYPCDSSLFIAAVETQQSGANGGAALWAKRVKAPNCVPAYVFNSSFLELRSRGIKDSGDGRLGESDLVVDAEHRHVI